MDNWWDSLTVHKWWCLYRSNSLFHIKTLISPSPHFAHKEIKNGQICTFLHKKRGKHISNNFFVVVFVVVVAFFFSAQPSHNLTTLCLMRSSPQIFYSNWGQNALWSWIYFINLPTGLGRPVQWSGELIASCMTKAEVNHCVSVLVCSLT